MSILDKLMEKKDLRAYIEFRIPHLEDEKRKIPDRLEPQKREPAIKQIEGRIKELKHLRELLEEDRIKEASKMHWEDIELNKGDEN